MKRDYWWCCLISLTLETMLYERGWKKEINFKLNVFLKQLENECGLNCRCYNIIANEPFMGCQDPAMSTVWHCGSTSCPVQRNGGLSLQDWDWGRLEGLVQSKNMFRLHIDWNGNSIYMHSYWLFVQLILKKKWGLQNSSSHCPFFHFRRVTLFRPVLCASSKVKLIWAMLAKEQFVVL